MKIISIAYFILLVFIMSACTQHSTLHYNNATLNLHVKNTTFQISGIELSSNSENFSSLFLEKKLIKLEDGSMLMYEHAQTDLSYEFAQTTSRTVSIVFDAKQMIKVYEQELVYVYQLILADKRVLNVLVSQRFDREFTMIYGMSSVKLDKLLQKLNPLAKPVPYRNVITLENISNPILSKWSTMKIHFTPLVQPLPPFVGI